MTAHHNNHDILAVPALAQLDAMPVDTLITTIDDRGVRRTIENIVDREYPYRPLTAFSMAHTDSTLYIDFFVRCNFLRAVNYQTNSPVNEDSAVVAMFQPHPGVPTYYTLIFNCIGTIAGFKVSPDMPEPEPLDPELLARIVRVPSCGTRPFQELEGLFSWNILVAIPLDLFGIGSDGFPTEMRGNFFKCATGTSQPHFLSWLPVDHHALVPSQTEGFGAIILE